jgi:hypothetical protein
MYQLGMARISSNRMTRSSNFGGAVVDSFAPGLGVPQSLGQAGQGYYNSAKAAIAQFDSIVERLKKVANQTVRDSIAVQYGLTNAADKTKAFYMRAALAYDVSVADSSTPDEGFPPTGPSRGRITKLQSFNTQFSAAVQDAENTYGILPAPETITNYVTTTTPQPLNWIIPVVALGLGVVIAGFAGLFRGK